MKAPPGEGEGDIEGEADGERDGEATGEELLGGAPLIVRSGVLFQNVMPLNKNPNSTIAAIK